MDDTVRHYLLTMLVDDTVRQYTDDAGLLVVELVRVDDMAPVKLPRYVMFEGDNDSYLCLHDYQMGAPYLSFNCKERNLWGVHEIIPVKHSIHENVVPIKSLQNKHFWRRHLNSWILADWHDKPSIDNTECLFLVVVVGLHKSKTCHKVALLSLAGDRYVKRLTADGKENCLIAALEATHYNSDNSCQMILTEAVSFRRVYDVTYLWDKLQLTSKQVECLGQDTAVNMTRYKTDLEKSVDYDYESKYSWRTSTTVTTDVSGEITVGIPEIGLGSKMSVSTGRSDTREFGKEVTTGGKQTGKFKVKDVEPGDTVTIKVLGTRSIGTLPFKYKYQNTRVDGLIMDEDTAEDGVFSGFQVTDTKWVATSASGAPKQVIPIEVPA